MAEVTYNSFEEFMRAQVEKFNAPRDINLPGYDDNDDDNDNDNDDNVYYSCADRQAMIAQNAADCQAAVDKYIAEQKANDIQSAAIDAQKALVIASIAAAAARFMQR
jgi:hypothetical protein